MQDGILKFPISGAQLRVRIQRLGMTYTQAAKYLGLTLDGLNKQMRGVTAVSKQTTIIIGYLEAAQRVSQGKELEALILSVSPVNYPEGKRDPIAKADRPAKPSRNRNPAKYLY